MSSSCGTLAGAAHAAVRFLRARRGDARAEERDAEREREQGERAARAAGEAGAGAPRRGAGRAERGVGASERESNRADGDPQLVAVDGRDAPRVTVPVAEADAVRQRLAGDVGLVLAGDLEQLRRRRRGRGRSGR